MNSPELLISHRSVEEIFADIEDVQPKPISLSVASNIDDERNKFIAGKIDNPEFIFDRLQQFDTHQVTQKLLLLREELLSSPYLDNKQLPLYIAFIERSLKIIEFLESAKAYNLADSDFERTIAANRYRALNNEVYGDIDFDTFEAIIEEKIKYITSKEFDVESTKIRDELLLLIPEISASKDRYKPSVEVIKYLSNFTENMYGSMLKYVDESKDIYLPTEVKAVFDEIITNEFGEAAKNWKVNVEKATSINVVAQEMIIKIPIDRDPISPQELKGLIVHELGVHFLRALMGAETDIKPLKIGLDNYYDAEEGLGKIFDSIVNEDYVDTGAIYYIIIGLLNSGYDFRSAYEVIWRLKVLDPSLRSKTDDTHEKIQESAFKNVYRITRLTNGLIWNKDSSYIDGQEKMWKYIEENMGDYEKLAVLFYGKLDPTNKVHERAVYEAKST